MIRSFGDRATERLWLRNRVPSIDTRVQQATIRKLRLLAAAVDLNDLRLPPGNRLEALKGDRRGKHSIRVNDQWRICFAWKDGGAEDVELVYYH